MPLPRVPSVVNPLADNPLESRTDFQRAVRSLFAPVEPYYSPGSARMTPGETGAHFPAVGADFEGFSRPLWGLVPLAAGGGEFDRWSLYRRGLANGTDPDHEEYWGPADDYSQRLVDMAAVGFGLALAPGELWDPLDAGDRADLVAWLDQINDAALVDSNWQFFRVLVNLGLREVGAEHDWERTQKTLDRLESFYLGDGWYADGPADERPCDHYIPWAMHFYGLVYAAVADGDDPERAERFRERAAAFADEYRHWFHADGQGLPYGRSLTYRFAQASFWGAMAFSGVDGSTLSWGQIRGLWARNIRWWAERPIFTADGVLTIGYGYPNLKMSEPYNSPSSPYWAVKAFLPLALPADHPFWRAEAEPLPGTAGREVQTHPKMVVCRDDGADHHYALTAGQNSTYLEKYTKFAYSTEFGFSVRSRATGLAGAGHDSALALSEDGTRYRIRLEVTDAVVDESPAAGPVLYSRWTPWPDVTVDTWLAPASPWHVRVHRLETGRPLHSGEGGFPLSMDGDGFPGAYDRVETDGAALARYPAGTTGIRDLRFGRDDDCERARQGRAVDQDPNTNVLAPRTVVPTLTARHEPGTHWLVTAATAAPGSGDCEWGRPPILADDGERPVLRNHTGDPLLHCDESAPGSLAAFAPR